MVNSTTQTPSIPELDQLEKDFQTLQNASMNKNPLVRKYHWVVHGKAMYARYERMDNMIRAVGGQINQAKREAPELNKRIWTLEFKSDQMRSRMVACAKKRGITSEIKPSLDVYHGSPEQNLTKYIFKQNLRFNDPNTTPEKKIQIAKKCGYIYLQRSSLLQPSDEACAWFTKAADLGDPEAALELGRIYVAQGKPKSAIYRFNRANTPGFRTIAQLELRAISENPKTQVEALVELHRMHRKKLEKGGLDQNNYNHHLEMAAYYIKRAYDIEPTAPIRNCVIALPAQTIEKFFKKEWDNPSTKLKIAKYKNDLDRAKENYLRIRDIDHRLKYGKRICQLASLYIEAAEKNPKESRANFELAARYLQRVDTENLGNIPGISKLTDRLPEEFKIQYFSNYYYPVFK